MEVEHSTEGDTAAVEASWEQTSESMDRSMLMARDPILFWDEVPLYESELDDNGVSQLRVKVCMSICDTQIRACNVRQVVARALQRSCLVFVQL